MRLLRMAGRVYLPFLMANAAAVGAGDEQLSLEIDGRTYTQATFGYQAKCLTWLREACTRVPGDALARIRPALEETGCWAALNP